MFSLNQLNSNSKLPSRRLVGNSVIASSSYHLAPGSTRIWVYVVPGERSFQPFENKNLGLSVHLKSGGMEQGCGMGQGLYLPCWGLTTSPGSCPVMWGSLLLQDPPWPDLFIRYQNPRTFQVLEKCFIIGVKSMGYETHTKRTAKQKRINVCVHNI